jgi:hypothetical protein
MQLWCRRGGGPRCEDLSARRPDLLVVPDLAFVLDRPELLGGRRRSVLLILGVMVSVVLLDHLDRGPHIARDFPEIDASCAIQVATVCLAV